MVFLVYDYMYMCVLTKCLDESIFTCPPKDENYVVHALHRRCAVEWEISLVKQNAQDQFRCPLCRSSYDFEVQEIVNVFDSSGYNFENTSDIRNSLRCWQEEQLKSTESNDVFLQCRIRWKGWDSNWDTTVPFDILYIDLLEAFINKRHCEKGHRMKRIRNSNNGQSFQCLNVVIN